MTMLGQLRSVALALFLCQTSAFTGVISKGGAISAGNARANTAVPPRAIDGVDHQQQLQQQFGAVRARGGAVVRRQAAASVPASDGGGLVVKSGGDDGLLAAYLRALDDKPIITKVITSGVICGVGDIMAQALSFKTAATQAVSLGAFLSALEFKRLAIYTVLGAVWIAPVVHYWFDALEVAFKDKKPAGSAPPTFAMKMFKALKMVTLDQTIGAPLVNAGFMFLFTLATALTTGSGVAEAGRQAGSKLKNNLWGTLLVCWKVWPIANMINFAFVPAKLRVLFMNFVGLGWNIFLSAAVN